MGDCPATIRIVRARVIRWKHAGNACDCENKIVQLEGSHQRRAWVQLEAKCGRCHQTVRLYQVRGRKRYTIDPNHF
jgi:hypothetical protein